LALGGIILIKYLEFDIKGNLVAIAGICKAADFYSKKM